VRYDGEVEGDAVGSRLHSDFLFFTEHMLFNQPVGVALRMCLVKEWMRMEPIQFYFL
jgi:hypothetical protein